MDLDRLLETARAAAAAAADSHADHLGRIVATEADEKGRSDYVSAADLAAQARALDVIGERHPDHGILAEEMDAGEQAQLIESGGPVWVVDPLDGTTNFLHGHPMFAASVGLTVDGVFVVGAVTQTTTGESWWGRKGGGAWWGRPGTTARRLRVTPAISLDRTLIGTGFPFKALDLLPQYLAQFDRVLRASSGVRRTGSAALDLCYVASGRLDGFWELSLSPWDFAAGVVLVREAGGVVERVEDGDINLDSGSVAAASDPVLLHALRALVAGGA